MQHLCTTCARLQVRGVEEVQWRQPYLELRRQYIREPVYEMRGGGWDPVTHQSYPPVKCVAYYKKVEVAPKDGKPGADPHRRRAPVRVRWLCS